MKWRRYWTEPTLRSIRNGVVSLVRNDDDYRKTFALVRDAPVVRVPYSYFQEIPHFEPYRPQDLQQRDLDPRVRHIVRGFRSGAVPLILATCTSDGDVDVHDGFTRAAVAMALHIPIYAKVVCKSWA